VCSLHIQSVCGPSRWAAQLASILAAYGKRCSAVPQLPEFSIITVLSFGHVSTGRFLESISRLRTCAS